MTADPAHTAILNIVGWRANRPDLPPHMHIYNGNIMCHVDIGVFRKIPGLHSEMLFLSEQIHAEYSRISQEKPMLDFLSVQGKLIGIHTRSLKSLTSYSYDVDYFLCWIGFCGDPAMAAARKSQLIELQLNVPDAIWDIVVEYSEQMPLLEYLLTATEP